MKLRVLALYPEQMNIYADRGNILFLQRRCEWRESASSTQAPGRVSFDPAAHDVVYIGGGQDRDQRLVAEDMLRTKRDALAGAVEDGAVVLAVCGGYQLIGHSYQLGDERIPGLALVDFETVREPGPRLIGNVAIEAELGDGTLEIAGFENHGGRTYLGAAAKPLGRVIPVTATTAATGSRGSRPQPDRHLPARPAAAEERPPRRSPDRTGARTWLGRGARPGAARRPARGRRTSARAAALRRG